MEHSRTAPAGAGDALRGASAVDELDLVLINALQLHPRATWTELAPILRVDAVTLARRWRRLVRDGCAWVTCYPRPGHLADSDGGLAFVEVDVERGALDAVTARLADDPYAVSVERQTGGRDLMLSVLTARVGDLLTYVQDRFTAVPGIVSTRTHLVTRVYAEGGGWRLRSLDAAQRTALGRMPRERPAASYSPADPELIVALGEDGRASHTDLAARTHTSTTTVARRLQRLLNADLIRMRCEVAQPVSGWPIRATLWLRVPPAQLDNTAHQLTGHPEVRLCAGVAGAANMMLVAWLRQVGDVPRLEVELLTRFPEIAVVDRAVTLRTVKQMGRVLDEHGRAVRHVPLTLWDPPQSGGADSGFVQRPGDAATSGFNLSETRP